MISIPKGMKDVLPSEAYKWQYVENRFRKVAKKLGYTEIRTPMVESTELFNRGIGDTSDVVQKEMYTFEIAGRSLSMKPEGTAGVVRSFIENKLYALPQPSKFFYVTPCYRYEKMQKGRQREFHQFGIEVFGAQSALADAEVISFAVHFFERMGIEGLKLHINSIGCPKCRGEYRRLLQDYYRPHLDEMCETCRGRFEKNPMRLLDCKEERCKKFAADAPKMLDHLCDDCRDHFEKLKSYLDASEVKYEVDPGIVRGLDYYTKTAFEIISDNIGAQSTVCGGGRYDDLVETLGGPPTPGVGFGLGIERLLLVLEEAGVEIPKEPDCDVFVAALGEEAEGEALRQAIKLRFAGFNVINDVMGRGLKAQLKYADRSGARYTVIIGGDELGRGAAAVRDMQSSEQFEVPLDELASRLGKKE